MRKSTKRRIKSVGKKTVYVVGSLIIGSIKLTGKIIKGAVKGAYREVKK